jgi:hypothetical protein
MNSDNVLKTVIDTYTEKLGVFVGYDTFVEMWSLLSMKINRGKYLKEKYAKLYYVLETLKGSINNESNNDN